MEFQYNFQFHDKAEERSLFVPLLPLLLPLPTTLHEVLDREAAPHTRQR